MKITNRREFKKNIVDINISVQNCVRLLHSLDIDIIFVTKRKNYMDQLQIMILENII